MGIKDLLFKKVVDKMLKKTMSRVDLDSIAKKAKDGKYDIDMIIGMMEKLLGKEASEKMIKEIQKKVDNGEKMSMSVLMDLMSKVDLSKIRKEKSADPDHEIDSLRKDLTQFVSKKEADDIVSDATEIAEEYQKEEMELENENKK